MAVRTAMVALLAGNLALRMASPIFGKSITLPATLAASAAPNARITGSCPIASYPWLVPSASATIFAISIRGIGRYVRPSSMSAFWNEDLKSFDVVRAAAAEYVNHAARKAAATLIGLALVKTEFRTASAAIMTIIAEAARWIAVPWFFAAALSAFFIIVLQFALSVLKLFRICYYQQACSRKHLFLDCHCL